MNKPVYLGLSILEISKILCMNFGMIILNQSISKMQNYITQILTALIFILKLKMFLKILLMILKKRFDTSNYEVNRPLPTGKKNKKIIGLMKDELGGKIMIEFAALRPKTYSYLMDDGNNEYIMNNEYIINHDY